MGKHLARVDGVIGDPEAEIYFYHTDHIGSVRAVTNQAGEVVWNADYLAFGRRFGDDGASEFEEWHGFTGKEYDPDTGLYYYNARWYDADIGRFISEDPARDPNNPNLYVYGRNNPLRFVDPTGLTSLSDIGVTSATTGASQETLNTTHIDGGGKNTTVAYNFGGTRTYTERNDNGNITRQMTFDRDGSIISTNIFGTDGTRTNWSYGYSEEGTVITQKKQERGFLGLGWKTTQSTIFGYNDNVKSLYDNVNWSTVGWGVCEIGAGIWATTKAIGIATASSQGIADPALVLVYSGTALNQFTFGLTDILGGLQGKESIASQMLKDPQLKKLFRFTTDIPTPPIWEKEAWPDVE